jgi:murein DD-endopeptidase MepM/ murein hydrolase activator NlpD
MTYNVSEEITKVNRNQNPTNLEITRTLNLNFKNPADIMDVLGFDEQQKMWAEFMYSAITWDSESGDYEAYIPGVDLISPIAANWRSAVTSEFGWRTDPFTGERSFHNGIDIEKPEGTDIMAVMAGTVSYVHFGTTGYGYVVRIDHGGVSVLATNYKHNIDPAFFRRMKFIVEFQFPDPDAKGEVGMKHYLQAIRYEFAKTGKVFTRSDFEPYANLIL